jgi:hypothetical protein
MLRTHTDSACHALGTHVRGMQWKMRQSWMDVVDSESSRLGSGRCPFTVVLPNSQHDLFLQLTVRLCVSPIRTILQRPPTMSFLRSLFYLFGALFTSSVAGDQQTTRDRRYICLNEPKTLGCYGKSVRLAVSECDESDPSFGSSLPGYYPLGLNISVHWREHMNDTTYPARDDPGYERIFVNYATGETDSNLQDVASSYFAHEGKNTSIFHTYDKPGIYRPLYYICATDPNNHGWPVICAPSCGYDNYYVDNSTKTVTFCHPMPFYIDADGTCSEEPILPKLPNQRSSSEQMFHSGWIHLGLVLLLATM